MGEPAPERGRPDRQGQRQRRQEIGRPERGHEPGDPRLEPGHTSPPTMPTALAHPVAVGYDGSATARNALAYAAGMARRMNRPLLMVYVASPGVYCEPLTGQVVGLPRDNDAMERWLLTELDQVTDPGGLEVHVRTRRGSPARELAAVACEFSADALVVGAPHSFWHHVVGSVSGWLARHACCPVVVVPLFPLFRPR